MYWNELNEENIEETKELYYEYLEENKTNNYRANLLTFEEFINKELTRCKRCEKVIYNENELCECCKDEMYEV